MIMTYQHRCERVDPLILGDRRPRPPDSRVCAPTIPNPACPRGKYAAV